jgi:hypothetical protein
MGLRCMGFLPNIAVSNIFYATAIGFVNLSNRNHLLKTCCGGV